MRALFLPSLFVLASGVVAKAASSVGGPSIETMKEVVKEISSDA